MMKKTNYYTVRDYFGDYFKRRLLSHRVILSKSSIRFIDGLGSIYKINGEQLINRFKSCTIHVNRSTYSIYSPEYIVREKYKYV